MKYKNIRKIYMKTEIAVFMICESCLNGAEYVEKNYTKLTRRFDKWYKNLTDEQKENRFRDFLKYHGIDEKDQEGQ